VEGFELKVKVLAAVEAVDPGAEAKLKAFPKVLPGLLLWNGLVAPVLPKPLPKAMPDRYGKSLDIQWFTRAEFYRIMVIDEASIFCHGCRTKSLPRVADKADAPFGQLYEFSMGLDVNILI
jgi:hypothetical protein